MPAVASCPEGQVFHQLLDGQIPLATGELLLRHLEDCDRCAETVERLMASDTLVNAVRSQGPTVSLDASGVVQNLMTRLHGLRAAVGASSSQRTMVASSAGEENGGGGNGDTVSPDAAPKEATQELYDFLAPPQAPDELGRLASYRVLKILGAGGMGVVFRAEDPRLRRFVALKAIRPALGASASARQRFLREARAAAAIKHDHVVTIYEADEDRGIPYLAMELLEGEPLDARLERERRLSPAEVLRVGREIAQGLAAAHKRGLVHRDIKPANVWLEADTGRVKLLDFGLARAVGGESQLTQQGAIVGTPSFMAPEQIDGGAPDHRCDLFSLGCVLYRMATGELPFQGKDTISTLVAVSRSQPKPPRALNPSLPPALADLILRLLAKDPAARPASAAAVVEAMKDLEAEATRLPARQQPDRKNKRRALVVAVGLVCATLLAGVIVLRITTDRGEIEIRCDDPEVEVVVKQGGKVVEILDVRSKQKATLRTGAYTLSLAGNPQGLRIELPETFTLRRGDKKIVRVTRIKNEEKVGEVRQFVAHPQHEGVWGVTLARDGRQAFSGGGDGFVRSWDMGTGQQRWGYGTGRNLVREVALSPDGRLVLAAVYDHTVRVLDAATGKEVRRFEGHKAMVHGVSFSSDGKLAASVSHTWNEAEPQDSSVRVWEVATGKELLRVEGPGGPKTAVFSPDGRFLLSGWGEGVVLLSDAKSGKEVRRFEGHKGGVLCAVFSPDGHRALSGGWDNSVRLWEVDTGRQVRVLEGHKDKVQTVAFSADGRRTLSASEDGTACFWDVETGVELYRCVGHRGRVHAAALSRDGKYALSGGMDGTVRLWRLPNLLPKKVGEQAPHAAPTEQPELVCQFEGHTSAVSEVALSPNGLLALTCSNDGTVRLWQLKTARELFKWEGDTGIVVLAFTPDGKRFLSASRGGTARLWDVASGKELRRFEGHTDEVWCLALSPDGKQVLTAGGNDKLLRLFDVESGKLRLSLEGHEGWVCCVAISPDGQWALSGGAEHAVRLWNLKTGKEVRRLEVGQGVRRVAFSPDGRQALVGGDGHGLLGLWDVETAKEVRRFAGDRGQVYKMAFTPDGRHILSAAGDGTVRLWEVASGREVARIQEGGEFYGLAVSRDGRYVLTSGSWSKVPKLYRLPKSVWPVEKKAGEVRR